MKDQTSLRFATTTWLLPFALATLAGACAGKGKISDGQSSAAGSTTAGAECQDSLAGQLMTTHEVTREQVHAAIAAER